MDENLDGENSRDENLIGENSMGENLDGEKSAVKVLDGFDSCSLIFPDKEGVFSLGFTLPERNAGDIFKSLNL